MCVEGRKVFVNAVVLLLFTINLHRLPGEETELHCFAFLVMWRTKVQVDPGMFKRMHLSGQL